MTAGFVTAMKLTFDDNRIRIGVCQVGVIVLAADLLEGVLLDWRTGALWGVFGGVWLILVSAMSIKS